VQVRVVGAFNGSEAGAVVVARLATVRQSPIAGAALLSELQARSQGDPVPWGRCASVGAPPLAVCVLAEHGSLSIEWRFALGAPAADHTRDAAAAGNSEDGRQDGRVFFYIVVPPATTGPSELVSSGAPAQLVWYCGLFQQARHREGAMRAVVDSAVAAKRRGEAFCKLAKDWARLEELVSTAAGGSAPRLDHLFAKTPVAVRSQLLLDATASYSVTDQATADDITAKCLRLPGVWPAGAAAPAAACVDLTACVGGNLLSFALGGFA
jgi:hypothetical protein